MKVFGWISAERPRSMEPIARAGMTAVAHRARTAEDGIAEHGALHTAPGGDNQAAGGHDDEPSAAPVPVGSFWPVSGFDSLPTRRSFIDDLVSGNRPFR